MSGTGLERPLALLRQGLVWWRTELQALLPSAWVRAAETKSPRVAVQLDREGGARVVVDGHSQAQPGTLDEAAAAAAAAARGLKAEIAVHLPSSAVFSRKVNVPPVGRQAIARILDLDMARATPFRPDEVYTTWWFDQQPGDAGTRIAHQRIAKRPMIDAAREAIARAGGSVAWVGASDDATTTARMGNFMRAPDKGPWGFALPAGALALLLLAVAVAAERQSQALSELRSETAAARTAAMAVRRSIDDAASIIEQTSALRTIKQRDGLAIAVLADLTAVLPDTAFLTELRVEGRTVEISGIAAQAAKLPQTMESSGRFTDVALVAPLTVEGRDRERFSIRAVVPVPVSQ